MPDHHHHDQDGDDYRRVSPRPTREDSGREPQEFAQYGMRSEGSGAEHNEERTTDNEALHSNARRDHTDPVGENGLGGSNFGAPTDHESFDDEFRVREERDHRARSIPTGLPPTQKTPE